MRDLTAPLHESAPVRAYGCCFLNYYNFFFFVTQFQFCFCFCFFAYSSTSCGSYIIFMPCCNVAFIVPFFHSLTQEFAGCCMRLLIACGTAGFSTSSSCFFICSASTLALSDPSFCLNCFSFTGAHSYFFFVPLPLLIFILYMFFFFLAYCCQNIASIFVTLLLNS